jgi:hypothetical protein
MSSLSSARSHATRESSSFCDAGVVGIEPGLPIKRSRSGRGNVWLSPSGGIGRAGLTVQQHVRFKHGRPDPMSTGSRPWRCGGPGWRGRLMRTGMTAATSSWQCFARRDPLGKTARHFPFGTLLAHIDAKAATGMGGRFSVLPMSLTLAVVTRAGLEPATYGLKVRCSTN